MIYDFEDCSLDTDRRELRRGSNLVAIEPQVFDLLLFLIRNRARVVSKDDLIAEVWNGRIVSESALYSRITNARHAIGDTGEAQRLIRTIARKGLRFVGEVREKPQPGEASAEMSAPPQGSMPLAKLPSSPERRQLTIMACNMVGATALAAHLDPEDFREVVAAYHACVRVVAERNGGFVAKGLADSIVVYFGYPQAHEDDAERAVRTGVAAVAAVRDLKIEGIDDGVRARVGIATGIVVVDDASSVGAAADHTVLGQAPLLAAQLLTLAAMDEVLVSALTRRLLGNIFNWRELDVPKLASEMGSPGRAYQVLNESTIAGRFDALRRGHVQLVGREEELDLLVRRWELAERGVGRVVLLTGEAGIGKSRLARALEERLRGVSCAPLVLHCSPHHKDTAFYPISSRASSRRRHRARRRRKGQTRQARSAATVVEREPRRGHAAVCRSPLHFRWGALSAAEVNATAIEGTYPGRPASSHQATLRRAAGADDRRGPAMDRSDIAGGPVPHHRRDIGLAAPSLDDGSARVHTPLAKSSPHRNHGAHALGPIRGRGLGYWHEQWQASSPSCIRADRASHGRRSALCRGVDKIGS